MPIKDELRKLGLPVTTAAAKPVDPDDDEIPHPAGMHGRRGPVIKLTPALVKEAVELGKIQNLADFLGGKFLVDPNKLQGAVDSEVAFKIADEFISHLDKEWRKKHAIVYEAPHQIVVTNYPEAEAAQRLHEVIQHVKAQKKHEKPEHSETTPKPPRTRAAKPATEHNEAAPVKKPATRTRKPKVEE
jgi:hypothetical protein